MVFQNIMKTALMGCKLRICYLKLSLCTCLLSWAFGYYLFRWSLLGHFLCTC